MSALFAALSDVFQNGEGEKLPLEEERATIALAKAGDEAATIKLVYAYAFALRMGVGAHRHAGGAGTTDVEDLRQSALLGLLEAIHAFDPRVHHRLAATVRGYIADAIAGSGATPIALTVPERTLKRFYGILREADGDTAKAAALAPDRNMTTETFVSVLEAVRNTTSLDAGNDNSSPQPGGYGFGESREEGYGFHSHESAPRDPAAAVEDRVLVDAALRAVEGTESEVVGLRYGFTEYNPLPDAEIGERLGLSRQKVQRTASSALVRMRSALGVA